MNTSSGVVVSVFMQVYCGKVAADTSIRIFTRLSKSRTTLGGVCFMRFMLSLTKEVMMVGLQVCGDSTMTISPSCSLKRYERVSFSKGRFEMTINTSSLWMERILSRLEMRCWTVVKRLMTGFP